MLSTFRLAALVTVVVMHALPLNAQKSAAFLDRFEHLQALHSEFIAALNDLRARTADIIAFHVRLNASSKEAPAEQRYLFAAYRAEFPALQIVNNVLVNSSYHGSGLSKNEVFTTDPKEIDVIIAEAISTLERTAPSRCFDPREQRYIANPACSARINEWCRYRCWSADSGKLIARVLRPDLSIDSVALEEFADWEHIWSEFSKPVRDYFGEASDPSSKFDTAEYDFAFCRIAALGGAKFYFPNFAAWPLEEPRWAKAAFYVAPEAAEVTAECLADDLHDWQGRLRKVRRSESSLPLEFWESGLAERLKSCSNAVELLCSSVSIVEGVPILSYVTEACRIRDVTVEDIKADLDRFARAGATRADLIQHEQLAKQIEACKRARDRNFTWVTLRPVIEGDCATQTR